MNIISGKPKIIIERNPRKKAAHQGTDKAKKTTNIKRIVLKYIIFLWKQNQSHLSSQED